MIDDRDDVDDEVADDIGDGPDTPADVEHHAAPFAEPDDSRVDEATLPEDLNDADYDTLQKVARQRGLPATGSKESLVESVGQSIRERPSTI